jgi:hypothetical protein
MYEVRSRFFDGLYGPVHADSAHDPPPPPPDLYEYGKSKQAGRLLMTLYEYTMRITRGRKIYSYLSFTGLIREGERKSS